MQENRAWERNAQRLVALLVPDQVDDVLIEKGFKIGAPRQTELAQRLLTNGNGLADPLLWLCALRSSFFGRLSLGFGDVQRSEEHTSELQLLMSISYAVSCLQKKQHHITKR